MSLPFGMVNLHSSLVAHRLLVPGDHSSNPGGGENFSSFAFELRSHECRLCATKQSTVEGHRKALQIARNLDGRFSFLSRKKVRCLFGGGLGWNWGRSACQSVQQAEELTVLLQAG